MTTTALKKLRQLQPKVLPFAGQRDDLSSSSILLQPSASIQVTCGGRFVLACYHCYHFQFLAPNLCCCFCQLMLLLDLLNIISTNLLSFSVIPPTMPLLILKKVGNKVVRIHGSQFQYVTS